MIYTYKPGFACHFDGALFHLWAVLPDAYGGEDRVITYCRGGDGSPADFREFVRHFEMHEVDEWCMVDGERVRTPHGPGIDPDPG